VSKALAELPASDIHWRGRPQTEVRHYLRPGELDLYVMSRVNFIDLRGGIYAFQPGAKLDHAEIGEAVKGAHQRGLIVYATVNCGVPVSDYDQVMGTFRELLGLGADGLWLSFDDKGPGEDPVALTARVLELGRQHQIAGHLIAITPPKGSYQKMATDFNRKLMAVPGMENAVWFWTPIPSTEALEQARALGLKAKSGWWHNWPRLSTAQAYIGIPPLSLGWSAPDYDALAVGGECLDAVMPWGGNGMGQHYVVPVIGWWGWNPRGHDWNALRHRIDGIVFGEDQAAGAMKFDDALRRLFDLFCYSHKSSADVPPCPPRLLSPAGQRSARVWLKEATALLDRLDRNAPAQTLISTEELKAAYLAPMRRELDIHRAAANLAYPEDWWPEQQRKILDALSAGDEPTLNRLLAAGKEKVLRQVDQIGSSLPSYPHIKTYVAWWRARVAERRGLEVARAGAAQGIGRASP
jgi:hypothetical protein